MEILHLTFHVGTANAIQSILEDIPEVELTTKIVTSGIDDFHYNMTEERANKNWDKWDYYYYSFDAIIVTDTILLSRPMLQNRYSGKLILLITNRFDYWDSKGNPNKVDKAYYDLLRDVPDNVIIFANNDFDKFYAEEKGIEVRDVINMVSNLYIQPSKTGIYYVPTYHNDNLFNLYEECKGGGINALGGRFKDQNELSTYKAIIHIPYTWNSIFLWDALAVGVPFIVPSKELFLSMSHKHNFWFQNANYLKGHIDKCEFYKEENSKFVKHFNYIDDIEGIEINHEEIYEEAERLFNLNQDKWKQILNL